MEEKEKNNEKVEKELINESKKCWLKLSMQNPLVFAFILTSISFFLMLFFAIIHIFFIIKIASILPIIIYFALVICLGLIYKNKYNERLSKDLIFKAAFFNSAFIAIIFSIASVIVFFNRSNIGSIIIIFTSVGFLGQFLFAYFGLRFSNFISLSNIKLIQKSTFKLLPDESVIFKAKRMTVKTFMIQLTFLILLGFYMYFRGINLMLNLGIGGKIVLTGIFIYIIADIIDRFFVSSFILTNKKIIIKRFCIYNEILLNEIEYLKAVQVLSFGHIIILNKNGSNFKSGVMVKPNEIKIEVDKYVQSLPNNIE